MMVGRADVDDLGNDKIWRYYFMRERAKAVVNGKERVTGRVP